MENLKNTNTVKQYIKDAIIKWYINEYSDSTSHVIYHESLEKIENIHCSLIDSPFGKLFHLQASPLTEESKKSIFFTTPPVNQVKHPLKYAFQFQVIHNFLKFVFYF